MKVYELIQDLVQLKPDTEVEFHVKAKFDTDVEAEFDRNNENDPQEVTVTAEFDEDVDFYEIDDSECSVYNPRITFNLEY